MLETLRRGLIVFQTLRAVEIVSVSIFGFSFAGVWLLVVETYTGPALVVAFFLGYVLWLGQFRAIRIASPAPWRRHIPWGVLWDFRSLMAMSNAHGHGLYVSGFWVKGYNRTSNPIRLESARMVSMVTDRTIEARIATDPHYVTLDQANRIPPKTDFVLQFLLYDPAEQTGPTNGLKEAAFWSDFGSMEFQATIDGRQHKKRLENAYLRSFVDRFNPPPTPQPRVTAR